MPTLLPAVASMDATPGIELETVILLGAGFAPWSTSAENVMVQAVDE